MTEAVIVSAARTPIGKAYRGAFNATTPAMLAGHAVKCAVERAGIEPAEVEDVWMGCGFPEGPSGQNVARHAALWAGIPVTAGAATVNRFCSSGLQTIAIAAQRVIVDKVPVAVAAGLETISHLPFEHQDASPTEVRLNIESNPPAFGKDALTNAQEVGLLIGKYARQLFADKGGLVTDTDGTHAVDCSKWYEGEEEEGVECDCGYSE